MSPTKAISFLVMKAAASKRYSSKQVYQMLRYAIATSFAQYAINPIGHDQCHATEPCAIYDVCTQHLAHAQVWPWEIATDGVEMRNFVPHGTQVFLVRCSCVGEHLLCKSRNVKPLMIIPGPSAPKDYAPYWRLILDLFASASPLSGMCQRCVELPMHSAGFDLPLWVQGAHWP